MAAVEFTEGVVNPDINIEDLLKFAHDTKKLEKICKSKDIIRILILGKTGVGKSTLISGLIGKGPKGPEVCLGLSTSGVTTKVDPFYKIIENVGVIVYDSPGLQDGSDNDEKYLDMVYKRCKDLDLVIFTIRMDNRFTRGNPDVKAMVKFTKKFGHSVWNKAIVIITCANLAECFFLEIASLPSERKKDFFKEVMSDYKKVVHDTLKNEAHIPAEIVEKVKVIPTGHKSNSLLLDGTLWFSRFWLECLTTFSTLEARVAMIKANAARICTETPANENRRPISEWNIVYPLHTDLSRSIGTLF